MTKSDLVNSLLSILTTKQDAKKVVNMIFSKITDSLRQGENVKISSFGTFYIKISSPRKIILRSKEIQTKPRIKVKFKPSRKLSNVLKSQ